MNDIEPNLEKSKSNFMKICCCFAQIIKNCHKSYHFWVSTVNTGDAMLKPECGSHQPHFHSNMAASMKKPK